MHPALSVFRTNRRNRQSDIRVLADEELMQLVRQGDPRAFETVYDRHGGAAFSLAYRMVGNRTVAEDVVQEAFLSIWRSRLRYESDRGSVRSWVLGIVYTGVAIWGFAIGSGGSILGFLPVNSEDNVLHLLIALAGLFAGLATPATPAPSDVRAEPGTSFRELRT